MKLDKKGLTLIEVIIVIAIIGIITVPIIEIMLANNKIVKTSNDTMHINTVLISARDYIQRELRFAHEIHIVEDIKEIDVSEDSGNYKNRIYTKDDELIYERSEINKEKWEQVTTIIGTALLGESYYVEIFFEKDVTLKPLVNMTIVIKSITDDGEVGSTNIEIDLINISEENLVKDKGNGGDVIGFTTY